MIFKHYFLVKIHVESSNLSCTGSLSRTSRKRSTRDTFTSVGEIFVQSSICSYVPYFSSLGTFSMQSNLRLLGIILFLVHLYKITFAWNKKTTLL